MVGLPPARHASSGSAPVGDHPQGLQEPRVLGPSHLACNYPATQSAHALGELKQAIILHPHEAPPLHSAHTAAPKDRYGARAMGARVSGALVTGWEPQPPPHERRCVMVQNDSAEKAVP